MSTGTNLEASPGARTMVVGFDSGPSGEDALAFARRWTLASQVPPVVVTVHPGAAPPGLQRVDAEWAGYEREAAEAVLAKAREMMADVPGTRFQRYDADSAAHALADVSETGQVILVLGSPSRGRARRTFPGSTAQRLFFGSASPVTVVPWGYADLPVAPITSITVAFIATDDGRAALAEGVRMAQDTGAALRVLTVTPDTLVQPALGEPRRFAAAQEADFQAELTRAVAALRDLGHSVDADHLEISTELRDGPVVEVLTEIGPQESDLLVCGSRSYGPVRRVLLGGVSNQVVRHARIPVTVVPRGE